MYVVVDLIDPFVNALANILLLPEKSVIASKSASIGGLVALLISETKVYFASTLCSGANQPSGSVPV